jgi:hypothetical protein
MSWGMALVNRVSEERIPVGRQLDGLLLAGKRRFTDGRFSTPGGDSDFPI